MRLIDAYKVRCDRDDFDTYADYVKAFDAINEAPTVDAVPVVHGKWISGVMCSKCGYRTYEWLTPEFHYCPNCGARMDAERKEE